MPVVGAILRDPALTLPERHLGLVQAGEHPDLARHLDRLADMAERSLDLDRIVALAAPLAPEHADDAAALPPPGQRIALARDAAFSFLYPHVAAHWRAAGAELVPFSPLADEPPAGDCDVAWLPGGYPELHAGRLAAAAAFRDGHASLSRDPPGARRVRRLHGAGRGAGGRRRRDATPCSACSAIATSFAERRMNLGYRSARLLADCALGPAGSEVARPRVPLCPADRGRRRPAACRSRRRAKAGRWAPSAAAAAW